MAISTNINLYNEADAKISVWADSDGDIVITFTDNEGRKAGAWLSPKQTRLLVEELTDALAESKAKREAKIAKLTDGDDSDDDN